MADAYCASQGARLATINSAAQDKAITEMMGANTNYIIGLKKDANKLGGMSWVDGSPLVYEGGQWNSDGECTELNAVRPSPWSPLLATTLSCAKCGGCLLETSTENYGCDGGVPGQCRWEGIETAKANCLAWPECLGITRATGNPKNAWWFARGILNNAWMRRPIKVEKEEDDDDD